MITFIHLKIFTLCNQDMILHIQHLKLHCMNSYYWYIATCITIIIITFPLQIVYLGFSLLRIVIRLEYEQLTVRLQ